ncbi:MAG TPA: hypothetical protein VGZ25_15705 [Gemmataceae bacterium]|nr:hypothetical protein [Gemmataceae bacterium]
MTAEELYQTLHRKPFMPFRVHLKDGRTYDIRFPELNMVTQIAFIIGIPEPGPDPFADHFDRVPIQIVDRVERLPAEITAAPQSS